MPKRSSRRPNATIRDVAARAGVSVPTVSRVLTGAAKVSPEKLQLVTDAIAELDFRPSETARALVSKQPKLIGVLSGGTARYGYAETIRGIEEEARRAGMSVLISVVDSHAPEEVERAVTAVMGQAVAGVIALKFDPAGSAAIKRIPPGVRLVAVAGAREDGVAQVALNEESAAIALVQRLLSAGHRTVHHVRVPSVRPEDGRTIGWRRALDDAGIEAPPPVDSDWTPHSAREAGRRLADDPNVTAIFCSNDEIAIGVLRGLFDRGVRVPEDVSVVGFDDHPHAELWDPAITTVRQDFAALGRRAFQMLFDDEQQSGTTNYHVTNLEIVSRESSGPAPSSPRS